MATKRKKKAFKALKKLDPKSVVREGEKRTVGNTKKAFKALKKLDPSSVVREGELKKRKNKPRKK
jgi:hypothetical protein